MSSEVENPDEDKNTNAKLKFDPRIHRIGTKMMVADIKRKYGLVKNESGLVTLPKKGSRSRGIIGSKELVSLPSHQVDANKPSEAKKTSADEDIYVVSQQME